MRLFDPSLTSDKYILVQPKQMLAEAAIVHDYKTLPLVLDVHDEKLNVAKLKGKIQAIRAKVGEFDDQPWNNGDSVAKYCNQLWAEYVQNAEDGGWDIDAYFFDNPAFSAGWNWGWVNDADPRIQILRRQIPVKGRRPPRILWIDAERWWWYYDEYYADKATATHIPGVLIARSAGNLAERIKEDQKVGKLPAFEVGIYSSPGFVREYASDLDALMQWYLQWMATYPTYLNKILPTIKNADDLRARGIPTQGTQPIQIGNKMCDSWQYGSNLVFADGAVTDRKTGLPCGVDVSIDLNPETIISGGVITPPPDPDPAPIETITIGTTTREVNLRTMPSITGNTPIKLLPAGTRLELGEPVVKGADTWREVHYTAYVADLVGGVDYLTVAEEPKI